MAAGLYHAEQSIKENYIGPRDLEFQRLRIILFQASWPRSDMFSIGICLFNTNGPLTQEYMDISERIVMADGYSIFRLEGKRTLRLSVSLIKEAISFCREHGIAKLIVDVTGLSGFASPSIVERYWLIQEWAGESRGVVRVAMLARSNIIDPQKFGVTVALNAGFPFNVFAGESEAIEWLLLDDTG